MVLHIVRTFFLLVVLAIVVSFAYVPEVYSSGQNYITMYIVFPVAVAMALVVIDTFFHKKRLQMLSGLFFGVLAGLAIAYMLSLIIDLIAKLVLPLQPALPGPQPVRPPSAVVTATAPANPGTPSSSEAGIAERKADAVSFLNEYDAWQATNAKYESYIFQVKTFEMIKLLLGTAAVFMCVSFVLQTKDDFRFVIPYVEFTKQTKGARPLLLDTSVIIDGRIADISETRILESEIIVPRFILAELQAIADSDDKLKRNRGRRGLDVLNRLQTSDKIDIRILDVHVPGVDEAPDVDAKLVALAKHMDGRIVTNDYNLNKVAQLRGLDVININDLANALKPIVLPGEGMTVKIIKPGEEAGQGVGYLEDGTMVVAEQSRDYVGKEIVITVTSVLQTSAGRMIFGRFDADRSLSRRHVATTNPPTGQGPVSHNGPNSGTKA